MSAGFVMVPAWLRRKKPSGNAYAVYVTLAAFGKYNPETGTYDECRPTLESLAEETALSESTVRRALAELYGHGALERTPRWDPETKRSLPTVYRVLVGQLVETLSPVTPSLPVTGDTPAEQPTVTSDTLPPVTSGTLQGVTSEQGPRTTNTKNNNRGTGASARDLDSPAINPVWSGTTKPLEEFGRRIDERTDSLMDGWKRWMGKPVPRDEVADLRRAVRSLVAEGIEQDDLVAGMKLWTLKGYTPAWLAKCVRQAQAPVDATPPRRNPARDRQGSLVESVQAVAARLSSRSGDPAGSLSKPWRAAIEGA